MDTSSLLYDRELSTIELTPEIVFERRSDVSSPNTSLSYASTEPSSLAETRPKHHYADLLYMSNSAPFSHSSDVPSRHSNYERPYFNSGCRKQREISSPHSSVVSSDPSTTRKSEADAAEYGIVISIKDIKGHPFVILKDKEEQKHLVPAPGDNRVKTLPRNYGYRGTDKAMPESQMTNDSYKSLPTQGRKARESSRALPFADHKPEQEKHSYGQESNQLRSSRSRSLSPKRASTYLKPNRSRSMSPPRNDKRFGRRIDIGSIKPVSHLIGYFEAGKPDESAKDYSSPGRGRLPRTSKGTPKKSSFSTLPSRNSTASRRENRFEAIERGDKYNINEVVPSVKNVTTKPEGRYFALTSPGIIKYKGKKVDDGKAATSFVYKLDPPATQSDKEKADSPRSLTESEKGTDDSKSTTRISKVKIIGPSLHADTVPTKTQRNAQVLSTTKIVHLTSDTESESSESSKSSKDTHEDIPKVKETKTTESPHTIHTQPESTIPCDRKRQSGIKFEIIKSEDTTKKKVEEMIVPIQKKHPVQHAAMSNAELQLKIGDLELYIKELQEEVENTMKNTDQSQHQDEKEKFFVEKKQQVQELEDLRSRLLKMSVEPATKYENSPDTALTKIRSKPTVGKDRTDESSSSSEEERDAVKSPKRENYTANRTSESAAEDDKVMFELKKEIKKMKDTMLQAEKESNQYKKELSRSRRQLEAQVNDLEEQLHDSDKRASELQMKNTNLESKLSEMKQASKSDTTKEKEKLEEAEIRAKEIEKLRSDNEAKARALRDSERKNSRLQEELRQMDVELEEELKECERNIVECRKVEQTARDLEDSLASANKNLAEKDKALEKLEGIVSSLKEKNRKNEKQMEELNEERSRSDRGLRDLKESMKDKDVEVEELMLRNSELKKEIDKNKRIVDELEKDGHDREDSILSLKKKLNESDSKILNLQEDMDDLKHDKLRMQDEEKRLREMIKSRDDQIRDLIRKNEAMQKNLEDKSAVVLDLNAKLVRLEAENAKLCKDIRLLEREVREKELEGDKYNQDYLNQKDHLSKLRAEISEKEMALKNATEAISNIDRKMKSFEKNHSLEKQERSKLETGKHEAEKRVKNLQEQTRKVERKYDLLRQESKDELKLRADLETRVKDLNDSLEEKTQQVNELTDTVEDLHHQIDKLCQENKRKENRDKEELDDAMSRLEQEKRLLANELKMTKEDNEELEDKISEFEKMSMDANKEAKELRDEVENLKDTIKEKTQLVLEAEDTIYQQKEVINELSAIQQSSEDFASKEMEMFVADTQYQFDDLKKQMEVKKRDIENHQKEKESLTDQVEALKDNLKVANAEALKMKSQKGEIHSRLEEIEGLLCDVRDKLTTQQQENAKLKSKLVDQQMSIDSANNSNEKRQLKDEIRYLQDKILDLETSMEKITKENEIIKADLHLATDKLGYMQNEVEIERSRASTLQEEANKHVQQHDDSQSNDGFVAMLENKIMTLEDKLEQEARELETITSHHRKTEAKLRDVLKQAEDETNRAISDRDMLSIRNNAIKQQLDETELEMKKIQENKRKMEQELQQQIEANFKLQQMVAAVGFRKQPDGSGDGSSSLLTSV